MFKIKEIKPMFNGIVTTAMKYVGDQYEKKTNGLIIDTRKLDGALNVYQRVIAVGETVRGIKPGDIVKLRYDRYAAVRHVDGKLEENMVSDQLGYDYSIPSVYIEGLGECLRVYDADVDFVVTKSEVGDDGLLQ